MGGATSGLTAKARLGNSSSDGRKPCEDGFGEDLASATVLENRLGEDLLQAVARLDEGDGVG